MTPFHGWPPTSTDEVMGDWLPSWPEKLVKYRTSFRCIGGRAENIYNSLLQSCAMEYIVLENSCTTESLHVGVVDHLPRLDISLAHCIPTIPRRSPVDGTPRLSLISYL